MITEQDEHSIKNIILLLRRKGYLNRRKAVKAFNELIYGKLTCVICFQPIGKKGKKTIDHIIPVSKGGSDHFTNHSLAHRNCNMAKGNMYFKGIKIEIGDTNDSLK